VTSTDFSALVATLDLPTKVRLLTGATSFTLHGEDSIGLAPMAFSDGPTGVRGLKFTGGDHVALFPNATLLASAWSEDTAHEVGEMLAEEAERQQIHVVLGPTINLHRSPLGGRLFEAYSEDPLLTGRLAAAYVKGLQGKGIGACLKHLVANESETLRNYMNSVVSEAALREVYLLPFEIAVEESQPWSIMAAYNDINGVAATEQDHVNTEVVKGEWGWDGLLMSDWFATKTSAPAALGGLDLVMPGPDGPWGEALVADVESGAVPESVIDEHVCRLLRLAERVGALGGSDGGGGSHGAGGSDGHRAWPTESLAPDAPTRREQLRRLATDGMVVLRNEGAVLPLAGSGSGPGTGTVALIGRHAVETVCMGGGSAQVNPPYQVSIAEGLRAAIGDRLTVVDGVEVRERPLPAAPGSISDPVTGTPGMQVEHADADGVVMLSEHVDGADVTTGWDETLPRPTEQLRLRARLLEGGQVRLGVLGTGRWTVSLDGVELGGGDLAASGADPGEGMFKPPRWTTEVDAAPGSLVEAVLTIVRSEPQPGPDGKLSTLSHVLASGMGVKSLVAGPVPPPADDVIAAAVEAARTAEVAVVVVGLTPEQETEGTDKTTLALPGDQDRLVAAVAAVASRTVVVVNAATPVLMPWAGEVDAVIVVGLPGQEGGHAVADALLGLREPAGRLVTSWPAADGAAPAWDVEPTDLQLDYTDGLFVGYRGFHAGHADAPAHWLGAGEGYGSWDYESAELTEAGVRVTVRNTSDRESREVVQAYFQPADADQPIRLVGWGSVTVPAGGSAEVEVATDARLWRRWDTAAGEWGTPLTGGELLVARGLGDLRPRLPRA
jgi:beta-glucosidase